MAQRTIAALILLVGVSTPLALSAADTARKPNILVIVADDLGYADVGFNGAEDIPTPNLDALAQRSIRCTNGYVTHSFCSPTRAGLLTGRYQQRFGYESNPIWNPHDTVAGLPLTETTLPSVLKKGGYVTGAIGKWHLGAHPQFHPNRRGFDEYFGLLGGGHVYFPNSQVESDYNMPLDRNGQPERLKEYLTDVLGREAAAFVTRHRSEPWFLYLAFNAPHGPLQADKKYLERVSDITDDVRRNYAGLVCGMDDAVGATLRALHDTEQEENTLVWFLSDNGGIVSKSHSDNRPLRGGKSELTEGGIRVPFLVSWPAKLPSGRVYVHPVVSLDIFATAVALAGEDQLANAKLDGVDLLPYLTGTKSDPPHERLFWRTGGGTQLAVRQGDWKWSRKSDAKPQLYNLANDIGEATDLAAEKPEIAAALEKAAMAWNSELMDPLFAGRAEKGGRKNRQAED